MEQLNNHINDIAKEYLKINDNDSCKQEKRNMSPAQAEDIAERLIAKLKSPESRAFYCLVAYNLDQGTIDRLSTLAVEKGRDKAKLFNFLARREMGLIK